MAASFSVRRFYIYGVAGFAIFIAMAVLVLMGLRYPSVSLAWFSVALFSLYLVFCVARSSAFILIASYPVYYFLSLILGAAAAESGVYLIEIKKIGSPTGAAALVMLFGFIFVETLYLAYQILMRIVDSARFPGFSVNGERRVGITICVVVLLICFATLYLYSGPVLLGVERSTFSAYIAPFWYKHLYSIFVQSFSLAVVYWYTRRYEKVWGSALTLLIFCLYFVVMFLVFGQKFSGMVLLLVTFVTIYGLQSKKVNLKLVVGVIVFLGVLFLLIYYSYYIIGRDPVGFMLVRISLQGQLIWSVLADPNVNLFSSNYGACVAGQCGSGQSLADILSARYLPVEVYTHYQQGGNRLSGFSPANHIFKFGIVVAILINVVFAVISAGVCVLLSVALRSKSYIGSVLAYKVLFYLFYAYTVEIEPVLISSFFWLTVFLLLFFVVVSSCNREGLNNH